MASRVTFPLPDSYLPRVTLTRAEADAYRAAAAELVDKTLEQELELRVETGGRLDEAKWKFIKRKDRLHVYKRLPQPSGGSARHNGSVGSAHEARTSSSRPAPMVIAVGKIEGLLEDALYGVHHKTTDEMRLATSFLNRQQLDSAVLHTIDSGTDADPFRYLGIKWRITRTPGGSLIGNRDVCVLEFVGTGVDAAGGKYGFHVVKSIDAPWFPELPDSHVVRARMMLCCIYRQHDSSLVDCFMKGVFDLGGEISIDKIAYSIAADGLLGMAKSIDCAVAKKLTLRLIQGQHERLTNFSPMHTKTSPGSARSTCHSVVHSTNAGDDDVACTVCLKRRGRLAQFGSRWATCCLCEGLVCSKCHLRQTVFARPANVKVACCTPCMISAKEQRVDPRDPYPILGSLVRSAN